MMIAPTPLIKDYLEQVQQEVPVRVLPTGVPADSFLPDEQQVQQLRRKLAGGRSHLFCTIARLAKEKNLEFLFDCLKRYKEINGVIFVLH